MRGPPAVNPEPLDPGRARNILFTLVETRIEQATLDDLGFLHRQLSMLAVAVDQTATTPALRLLEAVTDLLLVEFQLREERGHASVRRLLEDPG